MTLGPDTDVLPEDTVGRRKEADGDCMTSTLFLAEL